MGTQTTIKKNINSDKEQWIKILREKRRSTFTDNKNLYQSIPPFPKEIHLDINNRCNHKCFFAQIRK